MKPLSRRRFLQGTGVALALPWLETLAPAIARAQAAERRRYISLYFPNGTADFWHPTGAARAMRGRCRRSSSRSCRSSRT